MVIMQMQIRHSYPAAPDSVAAMMADESWLAAVAREAGAERWKVAGSAALSRVHAVVPAPERAKRFTGPHLFIDLEIKWDQPAAGGDRDGKLRVRIKDLPAHMRGTGVMTATEVDGVPGTVVDYAADFGINIPLIGHSLESAAAPYVRRVIDTQQSVGRKYLAGQLS